MGQNPIDALRELYKQYADKADADERSRMQGYNHFNPYEETNVPKHMVYMGPDLPPVTRAPMYRPQTEVLGGPSFANTVESFLTQVPEMRGRSPRIQHGPNDSVFDTMARSGFRPHEMRDTNLNGSMTIANKHISLNPRLYPGGDPSFGENLESTLGHELGHTVDVPHGPFMDEIVNKTREAFPRKPAADALTRLLDQMKP